MENEQTLHISTYLLCLPGRLEVIFYLFSLLRNVWKTAPIPRWTPEIFIFAFYSTEEIISVVDFFFISIIISWKEDLLHLPISSTKGDRSKLTADISFLKYWFISHFLGLFVQWRVLFWTQSQITMFIRRLVLLSLISLRLSRNCKICCSYVFNWLPTTVWRYFKTSENMPEMIYYQKKCALKILFW